MGMMIFHLGISIALTGAIFAALLYGVGVVWAIKTLGEGRGIDSLDLFINVSLCAVPFGIFTASVGGLNWFLFSSPYPNAWLNL